MFPNRICISLLTWAVWWASAGEGLLLASDHGNTCASATQIAPNQSVSGSLSAGDIDYFGIVVDVAGELTAYTTGSTDTFGSLLDAGCSVFASNDDSGSGLNFRISRPVSPGAYYISVRHFSSSGSGPYTLHVEFTAHDDHGDSCAGASAIAPNLSIGGQLQPGDIDYFGFSVPSHGTLRAFTTGQTDTAGALHDAGCAMIASNDDSGSATNFLIERTVDPGVYFVSVRHFSPSGSGAYTLTVEFSSSELSPENGVLYPQLALGGGWEIILLTTNRSQSPWTGRADLNGGDWPQSRQWTLNGADSTGSSSFNIQLAPDETRKFILGRSGSAVDGWLEIREGPGSEIGDLIVSFFFNFSVRGALIDSTGVSSTVAGRYARFCVERSAAVNTGLAIRRSSAPLQLTLYDDTGQVVRTESIAGNRSNYFTDLFGDGLPANFLGSLQLRSRDPFYLTVLRLETVAGGFQLTSIPAVVE